MPYFETVVYTWYGFMGHKVQGFVESEVGLKVSTITASHDEFCTWKKTCEKTIVKLYTLNKKNTASKLA